ncbi:MAG: LysE family translocator [Caldilineaceae bacterium]
MIAALLTGIGLGFSAGISPGPLMTLVISTTLARGFGAGVRVASAPLVTDLVIVPICVLVVGALPLWFEPVLSMVGGIFVLYLGLRMVNEARHATLLQPTPVRGRVDMQRGMAVNVLSPHPWLFWITVGAPLLVGYWRASPWQAVLFLAGFYLLLVGSKVAVAGAVDAAISGARRGGRDWFNDGTYRLLLMVSAGLLLLFGLLLLIQGVRAAL